MAPQTSSYLPIHNSCLSTKSQWIYCSFKLQVFYRKALDDATLPGAVGTDHQWDISEKLGSGVSMYKLKFCCFLTVKLNLEAFRWNFFSTTSWSIWNSAELDSSVCYTVTYCASTGGWYFSSERFQGDSSSYMELSSFSAGRHANNGIFIFAVWFTSDYIKQLLCPYFRIWSNGGLQTVAKHWQVSYQRATLTDGVRKNERDIWSQSTPQGNDQAWQRSGTHHREQLLWSKAATASPGTGPGSGARWGICPKSVAHRKEIEGKVSGHTVRQDYQKNLCRLSEELDILQNIWKQMKTRFLIQHFGWKEN